MTASRYARLNPLANTGLNATSNGTSNAAPVPEGPIQFSNTISDSSTGQYPPQRSSEGSQDPIVKKQGNSTVAESHAYTGSDGDMPPRPPKLQRTGSSLYRVASSVWSTTRKAVSSFNVPKVAAPWEHEFSEKPGASSHPSDTVRYFDYRQQRKRLFVNSSFQWLITAIICAGLAAVMYGFTKFNLGVTSTTKHIYNALITGLSLCLGMNLASSLKGYAQMMRWRFLACEYRSLQDFELVMNCDSQTQTFRLLWAGRTPGRWYPNKTQLVALLSITVNLALQVITALLGLTYSIDVSPDIVRLTYGNVSIADLTYIGNSETETLFGTNINSDRAQVAEYSAANVYGITGQDYPTRYDTYDTDGSGSQQVVYTNEDESAYWYRFVDQSSSAGGLTVVTDRTINCTAECQSYEVVSGGYGGFNTDDPDTMWDVTWVDDDGYNRTLVVENVATGATTWMANMTTCGDRCIQIYALQTADNETDSVPVPRFWSCKSHVLPVSIVDVYEDPATYELSNPQAQYLAGAIGWSGVMTYTQDGALATDLQFVQYPADSKWSPPGNYTELMMAGLVMRFTAGAIAAMDAGGPRVNVRGYAPAPAQFLNVKWNFAGAIVGGIPVAQFIILCIVVGFANKAIIKDTSHLSTARLLRPVVERLGDTGCLLTGDEIAEKLGNYRVIYGVRDPDGSVPPQGAGDDGQIRHVDVLDESEGLGYRRGRMPMGRYDGLYREAAAVDGEEKVPLLSTSEIRQRRARRLSL